MSRSIDGLLGDLRAEYERIEAMLASLTPAQWASPSAAAGWSVADVVVHLALTEQAVVRSAAGGSGLDGPDASGRTGESGEGAGGDPEAGVDLEGSMHAAVAAAGLDGAVAFARWQDVTRRSVQALAAADPDRPLRWAAAPLKPRTLATTRLAEHWAHGLDIAEGLGVAFPDTARLAHIAWLGHATLPYAFGLAGLEPVAVRAELVGPDGESWSYGPVDAATRVSGPAGEFCRVGARRLSPEATSLVATGPAGHDALRLLRNWA